MALGYWLTVCGFVVGTGSLWAGMLVTSEAWMERHPGSGNDGTQIPCWFRVLLGTGREIGSVIRVCLAHPFVPMIGAAVLFGVYVLVAAPLQLAFGVRMV
jgi:hypothetical protein